MTIHEEFDFTFLDARKTMLAMEARKDRVSLLLLGSAGGAIAIHPTREQWLEFRAALNHILDAEDVTLASVNAAAEPHRPTIPDAGDSRFDSWIRG